MPLCAKPCTCSASKKLNSNDIVDIAISPDSSELAIISYDDEVSIWSSDQLEEKNRFKVNTKGLKRIVYLTGYAGMERLPPDLRTHPCLPKPVQADQLVAALRGG